MRLVLKLNIVVMTVLLFSGCATLKVAPQTIHLDPSPIKYYTFQLETINGKKITDKEIFNAFKKQILYASDYRKLSQYSTGTSGVSVIKGLEIKHEVGSIILAYVNGEYYSKTGGDYRTQAIAKYDFSIDRTAFFIKVSLGEPNVIDILPGKSPLFLPIRSFISNDLVVKDLNKINSSINPELHFKRNISGEIDVKYTPKSVYSNFTRLMDVKYTGSEDNNIEKDGVFSLTGSGKTSPVEISIYPYRDGSKVRYEFFLGYTLKGDGTSTYDERKIEQEISRLKIIAAD